MALQKEDARKKHVSNFKGCKKNATRLIFKLFFSSSALNSTAIVHPQIIKSDDQFVPRRLKMYMAMLQKRLHTSTIRNQQEPSRAIAAAVLPSYSVDTACT